MVDADEEARDEALLEELSHELRTPLTALQNNLALMEARLGRIFGSAVDQERAHPIIELEIEARSDAQRLTAALDRLLPRSRARKSTARRTDILPGETPVRVMGDRRFDRLWASWDERVQAGESESAILATLKDTQLAEMLAADAGADRSLVRNLVATELGNRMGRAGRDSSAAIVAATARVIAHATHTTAATRRILTEVNEARRESAVGRRTRESPENASNQR